MTITRLSRPNCRDVVASCFFFGFLLCCLSTSSVLLGGEETWAPIPRRLPPPGIDVSASKLEELERQTRQLERQIGALGEMDLLADVQMYVKAVAIAVSHGEFWEKDDVDHALKLLAIARKRLSELRLGKPSWLGARGLVFRGYRSALDDSLQPYGIVVPEDLDLSRPAPLYVYLHGRREKMVELQFLESRHEVGRIAPPGAYVLHAFGRYCNAFKSAGEVDVFEAIAHARKHYRIDSRRLALTGFSMGGAGVWHIAAHYPGRWAAASPGAGFAETARYQKIDPDAVPWYERTLWQVHDAPDYVRNLFNLSVVAYSGENDHQIQAARVMEEAYAAHGRKLAHIIGPGMGHKYHPESLAEIHHRLAESVRRGIDPESEQVTLQTRTLRYDRCHWLRIASVETHWRDSRVDATQNAEGVRLETKNVVAVEIVVIPGKGRLAGKRVEIDGQTLTIPPEWRGDRITLERSAGEWRPQTRSPAPGLRKVHGLQGPIDDVFLEPFLVVEPSGTCAHAALERWVRFELAHFKERWRRLFRGDVRCKRDRDVTDDDIEKYHLILWGDRQSNSLIEGLGNSLPLVWSESEVGIEQPQKARFDSRRHVPVLIYPNPLEPKRYVVLNSGMTFREGHDRTNSLQNPKLPDWAILDISSPPTALAAGAVVAADFFDERWRVRP